MLQKYKTKSQGYYFYKKIIYIYLIKIANPLQMICYGRIISNGSVKKITEVNDLPGADIAITSF